MQQPAEDASVWDGSGPMIIRKTSAKTYTMSRRSTPTIDTARDAAAIPLIKITLAFFQIP